MERFDSPEEASSRVLEQQQRNDEQQCPSCAAELTETSVWTTAANETDSMGWSSFLCCCNSLHLNCWKHKNTKQHYLQCALKLSECVGWCTQGRWQIIPDTGYRDCKTASSIGYHSHSGHQQIACHVLLKGDYGDQCWWQPECTFLPDRMVQFHVHTCEWRCRSCILFSDELVASVSHRVVSP